MFRIRCFDEIYLGKLIASLVPGYFTTIVGFGFYALIVNTIVGPEVGGWFFPTGDWWLLMLSFLRDSALSEYLDPSRANMSDQVPLVWTAASSAGRSISPFRDEASTGLVCST